ncbi:MAG: glycoside hydrolase family 127 protein [Clostridia bacterium]|nr:glycoside hydrolase family 127 protein [Clostridia bacterium]
MINRAVFNRAPLTPNSMAGLPLGAVKPQGWLREQLEAAAKGLTGKLYTFWPDVKDSAWRGGEGDAWERAPYYLDGLVPLAYLLEDEELIAVAKEYIEWTLASQREDGFFGPESNKDWWPRMVMLKVLMQYFTATADKRVPEFMFNYFKYQYKMLEKQPMEEWAVARGAENMQAVVWLYNLTGSKFLLELLARLNEQTLDWTSHFASFPHTQSMARLIPWEEMKTGRAAENAKLTGFERPYYGQQYHLSHVVNVAMGLKAPGVVNQFKSGRKELEGFHTGFQKLMKHHGVAYGMFTGDEHLSGASPVQGTELCAVVELMHTAETLLTTGVKPDGLGDLIEKLAFNALPGGQSADLLYHQYDQQADQVRCSDGRHNWYNNHDDTNLFGLEPNFGCCTANLHQGWPKYAASLWYATEDEGFAAVSYAPCTVRFRSGKTPVRLTVETGYPFEQTVRIKVEMSEPKSMPIRLRIPEWAQEATVSVDGAEAEAAQAGTYHVLEREWQGGEVITLTLPMTARITRWGRKTAAVEVGPFLMAYHPAEKWEKVKDHPVIPTFAVSTGDAWNYALVRGSELKLDIENAVPAPFGADHAFRVRAQAVRLPEWGMSGDSCAQPPVEPAVADAGTEEIELIPYGDTCLRISQFPYASMK